MKDINRRIQRIEKILDSDQEETSKIIIKICSLVPNKEEQALPKNTEEWITYRQQMRQDPDVRIIFLNTEDEIEARRNRKINTK